VEFVNVVKAFGKEFMSWKIGLGIWISLIVRAQGVDDSQVRPPVTKADVQIVKRAREILDSPEKWNRADNRACPAEAKTFSLYCAIEKATDEVSGNFEHRGAAMQEARFVIDEIAPHAKSYDHRLMGYNNDPSTTFADVQKMFDLLEARIVKRLTEEPSAGPDKTLSNEIRIVKRAREILDSPSKWNRTSTQDCPADAKTFGIYCAFEKAAKEVNGAFDTGAAGIHEARSVISETAPNRAKYQARLVEYNNDPTTSFADVQALFEVVEQRLQKRLAAATASGK
jgi:hypothetical protein